MSTRRKVSPDELSGAIIQLFADYVDIVDENVEDAAKTAAKDCVKELKITSPKAAGGGEYARSWATKKTKDRKGNVQYTVYNKEHYQLTHLLEYGHAIWVHGVSLGRDTNAIEHIRPAEQRAEKQFLSLCKKGVKA